MSPNNIETESGVMYGILNAISQQV